MTRAGQSLPPRTGQHDRVEVRADHPGSRLSPGQRQAQVARAGAQVEDELTGLEHGTVRGQPAPALVLTEGHQAVHQVVTPGDAAKEVEMCSAWGEVVMGDFHIFYRRGVRAAALRWSSASSSETPHG